MRHPVLVSAFLLAACAASPPRPESSKDDKASEKTSEHTTRKRGEPEVAASPQALLQRHAVRKIQRALGDKGYDTSSNGRLDDRTQAALRGFQRSEKIAATGMPDQLTLQRLKLDPKEILGRHATSDLGELDSEKADKR